MLKDFKLGSEIQNRNLPLHTKWMKQLFCQNLFSWAGVGLWLLFLLPQSSISSFQTQFTTVSESQITAAGNCLLWIEVQRYTLKLNCIQYFKCIFTYKKKNIRALCPPTHRQAFLHKQKTIWSHPGKGVSFRDETPRYAEVKVSFNLNLNSLDLMISGRIQTLFQSHFCSVSLRSL